MKPDIRTELEKREACLDDLISRFIEENKCFDKPRIKWCAVNKNRHKLGTYPEVK